MQNLTSISDYRRWAITLGHQEAQDMDHISHRQYSLYKVCVKAMNKLQGNATGTAVDLHV